MISVLIGMKPLHLHSSTILKKNRRSFYKYVKYVRPQYDLKNHFLAAYAKGFISAGIKSMDVMETNI